MHDHWVRDGLPVVVKVRFFHAGAVPVAREVEFRIHVPAGVLVRSRHLRRTCTAACVDEHGDDDVPTEEPDDGPASSKKKI